MTAPSILKKLGPRPYWANFLAQDQNGEWWWFEDEPIIDGYKKQWYCTNKQERAYPKIHNWRSSLINLREVS